MNTLRNVYKKVDNEWEHVRLSDVKKGDTFKMTEDGNLVVDDNGRGEWIASSDAYMMDNGIWGVNVEL